MRVTQEQIAEMEEPPLGDAVHEAEAKGRSLMELSRAWNDYSITIEELIQGASYEALPLRELPFRVFGARGGRVKVLAHRIPPGTEPGGAHTFELLLLCVDSTAKLGLVRAQATSLQWGGTVVWKQAAPKDDASSVIDILRPTSPLPRMRSLKDLDRLAEAGLTAAEIDRIHEDLAQTLEETAQTQEERTKNLRG